MTNEQADEKEIEALKKGLSENVTGIPEPKTVTLYDFQIDWESWTGTFRVDFGKLTTFRTFNYGMLITGHTGFTVRYSLLRWEFRQVIRRWR